MDAEFDERGYGLFAVEVVGGEGFVGFVGLHAFTLEEPSPMPFAPGVEIGWRLARSAWGRGYASEAARSCLAFGFEEIGLDEIVSFTSVVNERSQQVMRRIGMERDAADDFDHPRGPSRARSAPTSSTGLAGPTATDPPPSGHRQEALYRFANPPRIKAVGAGVLGRRAVAAQLDVADAKGQDPAAEVCEGAGDGTQRGAREQWLDDDDVGLTERRQQRL